MKLIPTAIIAPRRRQPCVEREGIERLTDRVAASRLTIINGPAGSGKTSAALYWFGRITAEGRPGLWIASRAGVRDLASFRLALKKAGIAAGLPWEELDPDGDGEAWKVHLATHGDSRPLIVIEDAQLLPADVLQFLEQCIASARDAITTIIVSRGAVGIPTARMRALGFFVEVGCNELRFSPSESAELLSTMVGGPVDGDALIEAAREMDGWASGLVMAGEYLRGCDTRGLARRRIPTEKLHAEISDYFREEVLETQQSHIRDFITATSILEELTPSACAAVIGDDQAGATLAKVHGLELFLGKIETEKNVYAYHPLFRKLVYEALVDRAPAQAAEFHRRASRFFAAAKEELKAIEHARLSGDDEFLADQLDVLANDLIYKGYLYYIDEQASDLPWSVLQTRPMLLLALAWRRTRRLSLAMAERCIATAEKIAEERSDDLVLGYVLRHRRILLEAARDNLRFVEVEAEKLLLELGDEEPYLSCTLVGQLMVARRELFHFHDIVKLEAETRRALERPGSEFASIALKATVAPTLMVLGKAAMARRLLDEALALAETRCGIGSSVAAVPALMLAEVLYDVGELDRSRELVDRYLPVIRQWGMVDEVAAGFITRARLAFAGGDVGGALSTLEEAHLIAVECGLDRLRAIVVSEQVRILVRSGQVAAAEEALRAGDIFVDSLPNPTLAPTRRNEHVAIAWLRIEIQRYSLARAKKVAMRWLEFARRNSAKRSTVIFQLLLAEIAMMEGDRSRARRAVREALAAAEPAGWSRIFLDEGDVICSLLAEAYASGPVAQTPTDVFAARVVSALHGMSAPEIEGADEEDPCLASRLIEREVEILTMVNGGLRNREIGERLGLTEGTVKWYLQQIFDKLGVRRRSQAVLRGRQLGIFG